MAVIKATEKDVEMLARSIHQAVHCGFSNLQVTALPHGYNQPNTGRYKAHCFFSPSAANCPRI